jgi:hypothetical protein
MEKRDYMMRQVTLFGLVLARILAKLTGLKQQEQTDFGMESVSEAFREELGIDLEELLHLEENTLADTLKTKGFNNEDLSALADILYHLFENAPDNTWKKALASRSLALYRYLETAEPSIHLDRYMKTETLKKYR